MKTPFLRWLLVIALLSVGPAHAGLTIVSADSSGAVSFTPTVMVVPVVDAVVACVIAAASLVVIWHFARWLFAGLKRDCAGSDPYEGYTAEDDAQDRMAAGLGPNPYWEESANIQRGKSSES